MILEDTPSNYITQLFAQVLNTETTAQPNRAKISIISFNTKRKKIDKLRVDASGHKLSNKEFKQQALGFFQKRFPNKKQFETLVSDAIDNYLILEEDSYFNY